MTGTGLFLYPCDRGVSGNTTARGLHHFESDINRVILCRYCGVVVKSTLEPKGSSSNWQTMTEDPYKGREFRKDEPINSFGNGD